MFIAARKLEYGGFRSKRPTKYQFCKPMVWLSLIMALSACAEVTVRKIPSPTQYVEWTDRLQREADEMEGFRFYLPRPFVNVIESFPMRTDIYLADGIVSADGRFVEIFQVRGDPGGERFGKLPGVGSKIDSRFIGTATDSSPENQAAKDEDGAETIEPAIPQDVPPAGGVTQEAPKTSSTKQGVMNDNFAYAYQPMRGNFDIAYLPDFEEQYVISGSAGLGSVEFQLNLGQGWSLQGFDSLADNTALNSRIFDIIDGASRDAQSVALATTLLPAAPSMLPGNTAIAPQSSRDQVMVAGTRVTLRIVVVHYAAKGLYPVIKPRELEERVTGEFDYLLWFDLFQWFPGKTAGTRFNDRAIVSARNDVTGSAHSTKPRYPYQYISFNTFRYMAIEALTPGAHPFGTLYDKTGTQGDPGDRRLKVPPPATTGFPMQLATVDPTDELLRSMRTLEDQTHSVNGWEFKVTDSSKAENGTIIVTIEPNKPSQTNVDAKDVIEAIRDALGPEAPAADTFEIKNQSVLQPAPASEAGRDDAAAEPADDVVPAESLDSQRIRSIQAALCLRRNDIDGLWGEQTRQMLMRYQRKTGRVADGLLRTSELAELELSPATEIGERCYVQLPGTTPTEDSSKYSQSDYETLAASLKGTMSNLHGVGLIVANAVSRADGVEVRLTVSGTPSAEITLEVLTEHLLTHIENGPMGVTANDITVANWGEISSALALP